MTDCVLMNRSASNDGRVFLSVKIDIKLVESSTSEESYGAKIPSLGR